MLLIKVCRLLYKYLALEEMQECPRHRCKSRLANQRAVSLKLRHSQIGERVNSLRRITNTVTMPICEILQCHFRKML